MRKLFTILFLALLAIGCVSKKKLQQAAIEQYPVRDSVVIHRDTIRDTLDIPPLELIVYDTVECPPSDTIRLVPVQKVVLVPARTMVIEIPKADTTNWLRYTAIEEILKDELKECNQISAGWKGKAEAYKAQAKRADKWFWWFLLAALALIGTTVFRFLGYLRF